MCSLTLGDTITACLLLSHQSSCDSPFSPSLTQKVEMPPWLNPAPAPEPTSWTRSEELAWESARAISITAWLCRHPRSTEQSSPHIDSMVVVVVVGTRQSPRTDCLSAASQSLDLRGRNNEKRYNEVRIGKNKQEMIVKVQSSYSILSLYQSS